MSNETNNNYKEYLEVFKILTKSIEILESIEDEKLATKIRESRDSIDMDSITESMVEVLRNNL